LKHNRSSLIGRPPNSPFSGGVAAAFVVKHMAIEHGALTMKKMRHGKRSTVGKENNPGEPQEHKQPTPLPRKCNELEI
jgi:hypothetical protein